MMVALIAYVVVLAVASLLTFQLFGSGRSAAAAAGARGDGGGTDFFLRGGRRGKKKTKSWDAFLASVDARQAEMFSFLRETCCTLPVRAESVRVLMGPVQFFEELQTRVRAARRSIVMSALYVGDGPLARQFVACLEDRVAAAAAAAEAIDVCLLLDYNRMQDRSNLLTLKRLLTLAHSAGGAVQVRLCLFQTPCRWNGLFAPFGRAKEALGVQHTKLFCFDDSTTILSGANLSDDYFATRMDRYLVIDDNTYVAMWFADFVKTLCSMSHRVVCRGELFTDDHTSNNNNNDKINGNSNSNNNNNNNNNLGGKKSSKSSDGFTVHKKSDLVILPNALGADPSSASATFTAKARELLEAFATRAVEISEALPLDEEYDTFLFPTVQCGRVGVFHDSLVVEKLFQKATASTRIYLTSPYLNMYSQFVDELLVSEASYDFITASVSTNGWCGAKGIAGYIPYFYLQLERSFFYLMQEYGCSDRVRVWEFSVKGLTFHAKGLWFVEREEGADTGSRNSNGVKSCHVDTHGKEGEGIEAPYLAAYGSTNYGYRSAHKDVEAEVFLFTANKALRETLREELLFLLKQSNFVTEDRFVHGAQGRFQPIVSLLAQMGQDFL